MHSPFVYNLVTKCFYDKSFYNDYKSIASYKKALLKNKSCINVTDLGAGSRSMQHKKRYVYQIAKNAGTTNKRAKLLFRLTRYFKPKNVLELGTSLGIGTHAISIENPNANIITIEGCPNTSKFASLFLKDYSITNTNLVTGNFKDEIEKLKTNTFDFVFFDGNHQKEATIHYFETLLKTSHNDSVFIFDDIYWSKNMTEAWNTIKQHPQVTVTIDTFYWGFVFFRKEQNKEHFVIRA
ncbi:class I SAM-dependent methyltransferase [Postechiella marina]|uniref:O-methyltransferase n=1 Tax=Postechiella marina TaxID=943941 RepID=UPI0031E33E1C